MGDERRLDEAAVQRGVWRRDQGERGRAVDREGRDLDRGEGGAWQARGRR